MSDPIRSRIEYLIRRGEALLEQQRQERVSEPQAELMGGLVREGAPELFGEIAKKIFETSFAGRVTRKLTRSMISKQEREKQERLKRILENSYQTWYDEVSSFLSSVSVQKPSLKPPGNSYILLKKFAGTKRFSKVGTRIRHGIAILEEISCEPLVYNTEIPQLLQREREAKKEDVYSSLKILRIKVKGVHTE